MPEKNKKHLLKIMGLDFICIVIFYGLLLATALQAFPQHGSIKDVYTMNFTEPPFFKYLLQLFPVLTLSATFPVYSIILRDNIRSLVLTDPGRDNGFFKERILMSSVSVIPPLIVAFLTYDVESLVNYTGSYTGAIVQYIVPAAFVYFGRREVSRVLGVDSEGVNAYKSPFKGRLWVLVVVVWYVVCLVVVVYNTVVGN